MNSHRANRRRRCCPLARYFEHKPDAHAQLLCARLTSPSKPEYITYCTVAIGRLSHGLWTCDFGKERTETDGQTDGHADRSTCTSHLPPVPGRERHMSDVMHSIWSRRPRQAKGKHTLQFTQQCDDLFTRHGRQNQTNVYPSSFLHTKKLL